MLSGVSWSEYEAWLISIVFIYYAIMTFLLYFPALSKQLMANSKAFWNENRTRDTLSAHSLENRPADNAGKEEVNPEQLSNGRQLSSEIMEIIYQAGEQRQSKKQLLARLNTIMMNYNGLSDSKLKDAIDNLVKHQCETVCSICLNEEEQRMLWKGRAGGAFL